MRLSLFVLCLVLFAAAAGRYRAEASLQATERRISALEHRRAEEARAIQMLRAEIAVLESPERLARLADAHTDLAPPASDRLLSADDFLLAFGKPADEVDTDDELPTRRAPVGAPATAIASASTIRNALR
ncbi:MAG: hypothetical protein GC152_15205 [Alphaproteobacteria bacterium]|nr:hypothetical protein [Alphaproteobacteria bacterium]